MSIRCRLPGDHGCIGLINARKKRDFKIMYNSFPRAIPSSRWITPFFTCWSILSSRRRHQIQILLVISLVAAVAEISNLAALLSFLKVLSSPEQSIAALGNWGQSLSQLSHQQLLLAMGGTFLLFVLLASALRIVVIIGQLRLSALIGSDLAHQVLTSVLHRPYLWHLQQNSSEVISLLTVDVDNVIMTAQASLGFATNALIVLCLLAALLTISPGVMAVIALLLAAFFLVVFRFTRASLHRDGVDLSDHNRVSVQLIQEALGAIREVLLGDTQSFFLQGFHFHSRATRLASSRINIKAQLPRYLIEGFVMIVIVSLSLGLAITGKGIEQQLPLLGTLSLGFYRLLQPLQQCFASVSILKANQSSLTRIAASQTADVIYKDVVNGDNNLRLRPLVLPSSHKCAEMITIRNLGFRYSADGQTILKDLNLSIETGSRIALVGATGSGKSTLADVILGLLQPCEGEVLIAGRNLYSSPEFLKQWQRLIANVPQQIYLSDGSFAENIAFAVPPEMIDWVRLRWSAKQACIAEMIEAQPDGYHAQVGERGTRLSGGQRQRIGIARALYREAKVLVFDEATSALDSKTEGDVIDSVSNLDRSITTIMIAHRFSTIMHCDQIYLLANGTLAAQGTYDQLMACCPEFQKLARINTVSSS